MNPKFFMMVGIVGSGKSTKAQKIAKEHEATIFSSDELRVEMFGDINHQADNTKLFEELHKRIKNCLREGKNACYDATNINYKRRMAFLSELTNIPCEKICILMATPYEECLRRNAVRERKVPEHVIERMYRQFNMPYWYEGWDDIQIEYDNYYGYYGNASDFYYSVKDYDQNNSHHKLTLGEHCNKAARALAREKVELMFAGSLHDCGKPFCATNMNKKGEVTEETHYYDHQYVGAYNALFYNYYHMCNPLDVAILIHWHMQPYFNKEEKTKEKYRDLWGEQLHTDLMKLHDADLSAH
jgi:predicted kinase